LSPNSSSASPSTCSLAKRARGISLTEAFEWLIAWRLQIHDKRGQFFYRIATLSCRANRRVSARFILLTASMM
jgi:hypothetical protein